MCFPDFNHAPATIPDDAAVWPQELHNDEFFRRKGKGGEAGGDFESLKELVTANLTVRDVLIRSFQHAIARFDVDAFRIDTLKFIEPDFARVFGNAMRYATKVLVSGNTIDGRLCSVSITDSSSAPWTIGEVVKLRKSARPSRSMRFS